MLTKKPRPLTLQVLQTKIRDDCANLISGKCRIHASTCGARCCFFCGEKLGCDHPICRYARACVLGPEQAGWEKLFEPAALVADSPELRALERRRDSLRKAIRATDRQIADLRSALGRRA